MRKIKENFRALCWLVSIPIVNVFYALLNNPSRGAFNLVTAIDDKIPFVEFFIIPYMCWYVFIIGTMIYLCINDRKTYYKTLLCINLGLIICYIVYFVFQTTVPRPPVTGNDIASKITAYVYSTDGPYNCFPSIHVLTSYLMVRAIVASKSRNIKNISIVVICSVVIILSTLFVKQHVIADILSGMLLGDILFDIVMRIKEEKIKNYLKKLYATIVVKNKLEV